MTQIAVLLAALAVPSAAGAADRATTDRDDEVGGAQVHLLYVVPADGADRALELSVGRSFEVAQGWLRSQTRGQALRLDTTGTEPDVTFFRLPGGDVSRPAVQSALENAGLVRPAKRYIAYVDATGPTAECSSSPWPGLVAVLYLGCNPEPLRAGPASASFWEFTALREVLHTIGFAATCGASDTGAGFVSDSPLDLMYAGDQPWRPSRLDVGRDDYFDHDVAGCADLATSPFYEGRPQGLVIKRVKVRRVSGRRIRTRLTARCPDACRLTITLSRGGKRFASLTANLRGGTPTLATLTGPAPARRGPILISIAARDPGGKVTRLSLRRRLAG